MKTFRRCGRLLLGVLFLVSSLALGCKGDRDSSGAKQDGGVASSTERASKVGAEINRKTFSVSLPEGWTEDTKDDMYDPESFVFFENQESCLFAVVVGKKSAGASVDELLKDQKGTWEQKVTDAKFTDIRKWANYDGKGFEIEGPAVT